MYTPPLYPIPGRVIRASYAFVPALESLIHVQYKKKKRTRSKQRGVLYSSTTLQDPIPRFLSQSLHETLERYNIP